MTEDFAGAEIVHRTGRIRLLRCLHRILPIRHRLRPLLGPLQTGTLLAVPWCRKQLLVPVDWLRSFSVFRLVVEGPDSMPELSIARRLLRARGCGAVVDVGAHLGQFTLWVCNQASRDVMAFEPDPVARTILMRSLSFNGCDPVRVIAAACGANPGRAELAPGPVGSVTVAHSPGATPVPVLTLDEALGDGGSVALIKVDVEGFEVAVLRGARRVLEVGRPALLVEVHCQRLREYGESIRALVDLLAPLYRIALWSFEPGRDVAPLRRILSRYGPRRAMRASLDATVLDWMERSGPPQIYLEAKPTS